MKILSLIQNSYSQNKKLFALLLDPDKCSSKQTERLARNANDHKVDLIFVGSSLLAEKNVEDCIGIIRQNSNLPVVLFPGNTMQVSNKADALLFLSLISGRNPDLLIGNHVIAAPLLKSSGIETIPTGYMLIDPGHPTSVSYMSNTLPIPHDKNDIAVCTALAGEFLGLKLIFMDAGSGARVPISKSMIKAVTEKITVPLIAGGGIKSPEKVSEFCEAGATMVVVGNSIEKEEGLLSEIAGAVQRFAVH